MFECCAEGEKPGCWSWELITLAVPCKMVSRILRYKLAGLVGVDVVKRENTVVRPS